MKYVIDTSVDIKIYVKVRNMQLSPNDNCDAAILMRVLHAERDDLSATAARAFLKLGFDAEDRDRMHELAVKNQSDDLSARERRELESYLRVGRLLDLLSARAHRSLAKRKRARSVHQIGGGRA